MNKAYRTVYNEQTRTFVAVAENVSARGKKSSSSRMMRNVAVAVTAGLIASGTAFADVDIDEDTNTIEFIGDAGTITNVAAGTADSDAVNVSQLNKTVAANKIKYFSVKSTGGGNEDNDGATGNNAIAIGKNAVADKTSSSAMGLGAKAQGVNSLSLGTNAKTSSAQAVAIGMNSDAAGTRATAIGANAKASSNNSTAVGKSAEALGISSLALGDSATTTQSYSVAIGFDAEVTGSQSGSMALGHKAKVGAFSNAMAMGAHAQADGQSAYALGTKALAIGENALALGNSSQAGISALALGDNAEALGESGIAIGKEAKVFNSANGSLAIGVGAVANREDSTVIGTAAGSKDTTGERHTLIGYTAGAEMSGKENTAVGSNSLTGAKGGDDFLGRTENSALGINAGSHMIGGHNAVVGGYAGHKSQGSQNTYMGHEAGTEAIGSDNVAIGKSANEGVEVNESTALGSNAKATIDKSVALGANSDTDADATPEKEAVVGGLKYSGFAGQAAGAGMQVSVGSKGNERQIKNVAAGQIRETSTDAINGSQLYATNTVLGNMGDSIVKFIGGGVTLNDDGTLNLEDYWKGIFGDDTEVESLADALEPWTVGAGGGDSKQVLPGDNVDFSGEGQTGGGGGGAGNSDGNIVVEIEHDGKDHNVTFDLADNVHINESLTVGDTDGPHVTIGDDGEQGSAGSVTFYDPDEGVSASQTVVAGPGGVGTDQDADDGTRLSYTDGKGDDYTVATLDDGLSFGANDGQVHDAPLNTQVDIKGHEDNTDWSQFDEGQNIMTQVEGNQITVALANDLNVDSVTADTVEINNGPIINENGIDMRNKKITNLAAGTERTDAVNVGQLRDAENRLDGRIDNLRSDMHRMDKRNRAGIAAAMATAGLPQAYLPGKSMVAMGGATWRGETGMAIGVSTITDNGHWVFKLSGTTSSRGDFGGTAGVGYQW